MDKSKNEGLRSSKSPINVARLYLKKMEDEIKKLPQW